MVPFAGYLMPVQYPTGVIAEHMAVRGAAGLFDVSHMGEILLRGAGAFALLQYLLTNDMQGLAPGGCRYSPLCNERGGFVDDLIVYKKAEDAFLLVVNAANHEKVVEWITACLPTDVQMTDESEETAELALQGPKALEILSRLADADKLPVKKYTFTPRVLVAGVPCLVSRTGYTGEDGFELYCANADAPRLWDALLAAGREDGLVPCGLGARDTLRLEAAMPLYGHEMNEEITPWETGLGSFVNMDKQAAFIGKTALLEGREPACIRTGLKMLDRGIAREGCLVYKDGQEVGRVTSGTQLPFVGYAGAMALVAVGAREVGCQLQVDVRGRMLTAEVVKLPFYKREK